jgi:hypothetical protein
MNQTNQLLNRDEVFDYTDPIPMISKKFLSPLPDQIISRTASDTPDVMLEEQQTDMDYVPNLSKIQNNARRVQKAMELAEKQREVQTFRNSKKNGSKQQN